MNILTKRISLIVLVFFSSYLRKICAQNSSDVTIIPIITTNVLEPKQFERIIVPVEPKKINSVENNLVNENVRNPTLSPNEISKIKRNQKGYDNDNENAFKSFSYVKRRDGKGPIPLLPKATAAAADVAPNEIQPLHIQPRVFNKTRPQQVRETRYDVIKKRIDQKEKLTVENLPQNPERVPETTWFDNIGKYNYGIVHQYFEEPEDATQNESKEVEAPAVELAPVHVVHASQLPKFKSSFRDPNVYAQIHEQTNNNGGFLYKTEVFYPNYRDHLYLPVTTYFGDERGLTKDLPVYNAHTIHHVPQSDVQNVPLPNTPISPQRNVQTAPHSRTQNNPQRNVQTAPHPRTQNNPQKNVQNVPHSRTQNNPQRNVQNTPHPIANTNRRPPLPVRKESPSKPSVPPKKVPPMITSRKEPPRKPIENQSPKKPVEKQPPPPPAKANEEEEEEGSEDYDYEEGDEDDEDEGSNGKQQSESSEDAESEEEEEEEKPKYNYNYGGKNSFKSQDNSGSSEEDQFDQSWRKYGYAPKDSNNDDEDSYESSESQTQPERIKIYHMKMETFSSLPDAQNTQNAQDTQDSASNFASAVEVPSHKMSGTINNSEPKKKKKGNEKSQEKQHPNAGPDDLKFFQYLSFLGNGAHRAGGRLGNDKHYIEQHERGNKNMGAFQKKVKWADKDGGFGEHYWDLNHG